MNVDEMLQLAPVGSGWLRALHVIWNLWRRGLVTVRLWRWPGKVIDATPEGKILLAIVGLEDPE